jgi:site-specific DNA recombinase
MARRTASGAPLMGKLYDDRGNRMSPSFSSKNGVRYRFYVSSALLRGRKAAAGLVGRVGAVEIESAVLSALAIHQKHGFADAPLGIEHIHRLVVARGQLLIQLTGGPDEDGPPREIRIPWSGKAAGSATELESAGAPEQMHNEALIQSIVRAHTWMRHLHDGKYESIEALAEANHLHHKVVRQALRLAFLSPDATSAIIDGRQPSGLSLAQIPKLLPLQWTEHRRLLS